MTWTVGAVAKLAKVTVRTLHHYDAIDLLRPTDRSDTGYRRYTDADLEQLQQILFFRELGFALGEIRRIMIEPGFDRRRALLAQRSLLGDKARRTEAMLAAIDRALDALDEGVDMDANEMFAVFGDFKPEDYEAEVEQRWGHTDAYAESARRTSRYAKADWEFIKAEGDAITAAFVDALDRGLPPEDPAVQAVVERHWQHLAHWFYTPTAEMYAGLGDLYVDDLRFTRNIDRARAGLAAFQRAAMRAYAKAMGS
jgi:MerR family transcriptional regulator, thiopeptide resistance regulator